MVKKASRAIKAEGADKAHTENTFVDRDLYIVVCGLDGLVLAHGANKGRIDTNQIGRRCQSRCEGAGAACQPAAKLLAVLQIHEPGNQKVEPKPIYIASGSTRRQSAATHTSRSPGDLEEKNCDRVCL